MFNPGKLKLKRNAKRLTQKALAELIGVDASTVGHYEQGTRIPDIIILKKIAQVLDTSMDYLSDNGMNLIDEEYIVVCKKAMNKKVSAATLEKFLDMIDEVEKKE